MQEFTFNVNGKEYKITAGSYAEARVQLEDLLKAA